MTAETFPFYFGRAEDFHAACAWCGDNGVHYSTLEDTLPPYDLHAVVVVSKKQAALFKLFWNDQLAPPQSYHRRR